MPSPQNPKRALLGATKCVGNSSRQTRHDRESLRSRGERARLLKNLIAVQGGDLRTGTGRYTKPCLRSSQVLQEDIHRHQRRRVAQSRGIGRLHSSQPGASLLSPTLKTRPCQGCGREANGYEGAFRPAWIGAVFPTVPSGLQGPGVQ